MHLNLTLPDLLTFADGRPVGVPVEWPARRTELLTALLDIQYGHLPPAPETVSAYPLYTYAIFQEEGVTGTHYRLTAHPGGYAFHLQVKRVAAGMRGKAVVRACHAFFLENGISIERVCGDGLWRRWQMAILDIEQGGKQLRAAGWPFYRHAHRTTISEG